MDEWKNNQLIKSWELWLRFMDLIKKRRGTSIKYQSVTLMILFLLLENPLCSLITFVHGLEERKDVLKLSIPPMG